MPAQSAVAKAYPTSQLYVQKRGGDAHHIMKLIWPTYDVTSTLTPFLHTAAGQVMSWLELIWPALTASFWVWLNMDSD